MKKLLSILLIICSYKAFAQYGNQRAILIPVSDFQNAVALVHLPDDYNTNIITKYPLIIGFPGSAKYGTDAKKLTDEGLGHALYANQWDGNAINPTSGVTEKFVAISLLPSGINGSFSFSQMDYLLTWIYSHYRIDTNCVALTGLSRGAGPVIYYPSHLSYVNYTDHYIYEYSSPSHKLAAIIPMSAENNQNDPVNYLISDSIHVWGFGSDTLNADDSHGLSTHMFINHIRAVAPSLARFTNYAGGHCCWWRFYNASYKEVIDSIPMNIYQFVLYHRRRG